VTAPARLDVTAVMIGAPGEAPSRRSTRASHASPFRALPPWEQRPTVSAMQIRATIGTIQDCSRVPTASQSSSRNLECHHRNPGETSVQAKTIETNHRLTRNHAETERRHLYLIAGRQQRFRQNGRRDHFPDPRLRPVGQCRRLQMPPDLSHMHQTKSSFVSGVGEDVAYAGNLIARRKGYPA